MEKSRLGFSVVEFMVGSSIMVIMLLAASSMLKPLNQASRKAKLLQAMIKVENLIRNGVYIQQSYTDPTRFEVLSGNVVIAKHGETRYVNDLMTESSTVASDAFPIRTRLELVSYNSATGSETGVIYQVATEEKGITALTPLGVLSWPETDTDKQNYMVAIDTGSNATHATITIPKKLTESTLQDCGNGFLRGIKRDQSIVCWQFQGSMSCPAWSVPVGYRMNATTSRIEVLCQKFNKLACPNLDIPITDPTSGAPRTVSMPNFMVLNELSLNDLYPPRSATSAGVSQCESVMNLGAYSPSGMVPTSVVNSNPLPGIGKVCPDGNLYKMNLPDFTCSPTFDISTVNMRRPANVEASAIDLKPASETLAGDQ